MNAQGIAKKGRPVCALPVTMLNEPCGKDLHRWPLTTASWAQNTQLN